jgi:uncharacterized membrane protein YeaQ/YmgE (transglycosylase-associated protein family)
MFLIVLVIIGGVVGWLVSSFTEGTGGLGVGASVAVAIIGSLASGILFGMFGERLVGPGPVFMASLLVGAFGGLVLLLLVRMIKK